MGIVVKFLDVGVSLGAGIGYVEQCGRWVVSQFAFLFVLNALRASSRQS